jgi:hypothetical protein
MLSVWSWRRVFDGMPVRNVVSWNTMVTAYSSLGICDEELLEWVPGANIATWNAIHQEI